MINAGTSELGHKFRWRSFWWTIPKRFQVALVVLVVAGVAAASGAIVSNLLTQSYVVSQLTISGQPGDLYLNAWTEWTTTITVGDLQGTQNVHLHIAVNVDTPPCDDQVIQEWTGAVWDGLSCTADGSVALYETTSKDGVAPNSWTLRIMPTTALSRTIQIQLYSG